MVGDSNVDPEQELYLESFLIVHVLGRVVKQLLEHLDFALGVVQHVHAVERTELLDIFAFQRLLRDVGNGRLL